MACDAASPCARGDAAEVSVIWLIDADPPSGLGGRGVYPEGGPPPDTALMARRFDDIRSAVAAAAAPAVVTLHTSPRHRSVFFRAPYLETWQSLLDAGLALALHPHEECADGGNRYGDAAHLERVIRQGLAAARAAGLPVAAFRSGGFAWNPALPAILDAAGIALDLSPAPALRDPGRNIDWPPQAEAAHHPGTRVLAVPIGWSGAGSDLDRDYLFVERMDLARLRAVWDAIRARVQRTGRPALCNLLSHGFGLSDPAWRALSLAVLDHIRAHGGAVIPAAEATRAHHA